MLAGRLAAGDLDVQVPIPPDVEVAALAQDVNQMASRLRQLLHTIETERQRLNTVLATMADGIVIINRQQAITLINQAGRRLLGAEETTMLGNAEPAIAVLPAALQSVWQTRPGTPMTAINELMIPATGRSLRVQITRLPAPEDDQALLVLQDLTELRHVEQSRRLLMSNIAHDLRTPLASLQVIIETLQDGALLDAEAAPDFLRRMDDEVQGLTRLVNDVLDLSRIESGELALDCTPSGMAQIIRSATERMAAQAQRAQIAIACDLPPSLPMLMLDALRIEQALLNLLQNAIAHTPPGGAVTVGATVAAETVRLWVRDTGSGIAPDDLPHIFERLYKGDQSRRRSGTGLGLAIVKHLVERHGGRVSAESALGRGTTVTMVFPRILFVEGDATLSRASPAERPLGC
jgi:two-component system phosphate regulon sensor histidine kinase PhoR